MNSRVPYCATSWTCLLIALCFASSCASDEGPTLQGPPARDGGDDASIECLAFGALPARTCETPEQEPVDCTEFCPEHEFYGDQPDPERATVPSLSPAGDRRVIALDGGDLVDLTDPHAPKHIGWPLDIAARRVVSSAIEGDLAAVLVDGPLQLVAVRIADGRSHAIGSLDIAGHSARMTRRGELALVFSIDDRQGAAWLTTFRLSRSAAPEQIAQLEWSYASAPEVMQHGRVMASFAGDRVYVVRPSRAGAQPSTQLLAVEVTADGALETPLPPIAIDGLVLENEHIEESGGYVRVLATDIAGDVARARASIFAREDFALRGELAIEAEAGRASIRGGVAAIIAPDGVLIAKLGEPPGELYTLDNVHASEAIVIANGERLLVRRGASDGAGPHELALYDLTSEAVTELDTLEGMPEPDLQYSDELGVALYPRPDEELAGCSESTNIELVRVSSDGFTALGAVQVFDSHHVASAGERLLIEAGGRFAAVDPAALEPPHWINTRFEAERLAFAGEYVARVGLVGWSDDPWLDVVAPQDAAGPPQGGRALLSASGSGCARQVDHLHTNGDHAFAMFTHERTGSEEAEQLYSVSAINLKEVAKPRIVSKTLIPSLHMPRASGDGYVPIKPLFLGATPLALIFQTWADEGLRTPALQWLDLSDPKEPELRAIELERGLTSTFFASGVVASTHVDGDGTRWLQRTSLTDPADVRVRQAVELPGELLAYDPASDRALLYREPDESCSHEGWDLAIAELGRGASCVVAVASKQGHPTANARAFASLSEHDHRLRLGTWDTGEIVSTVVELPEGDHGEIVLTGTKVIVNVRPTLIYDARCPDAEPVPIGAFVLADVADSEDPGIFVRDGDALVPAQLPDCKK